MSEQFTFFWWLQVLILAGISEFLLYVTGYVLANSIMKGVLEAIASDIKKYGDPNDPTTEEEAR